MENKLFRRESLDRVTSPEQLQDYMRVTNPGIWMVLAAVIALLVGFLALSATQKLETTVAVQAQAEGGTITAQLKEAVADSVKAGMPLRIAGQETQIDYVYDSDQGVTKVSAKLDLPDGAYDAQIVTDSVKPISFLLGD